MSLLESFIFLDVMQIVASDDDGSVHLGGDDHSSVKLLWGVEGGEESGIWYFTILPLIDTLPVKGHFLSI